MVMVMVMVMVEDIIVWLLAIPWPTTTLRYVTSFWWVQKDGTGTRGNEMNSWKYDMVPNENSWMGTHGNIEIQETETRACSGASAAGSLGDFMRSL